MNNNYNNRPGGYQDHPSETVFPQFEFQEDIIRKVLSERLPDGKSQEARFIELQNGVGLPFSKNTFTNRVQLHDYLTSIGVSDVTPFFNFLMERHSNLPLR